MYVLQVPVSQQKLYPNYYHKIYLEALGESTNFHQCFTVLNWQSWIYPDRENRWYYSAAIWQNNIRLIETAITLKIHYGGRGENMGKNREDLSGFSRAMNVSLVRLKTTAKCHQNSFW